MEHKGFFKTTVKRFLFFVSIPFFGVFFGWPLAAAFAALFVVFYNLPLELAAAGIFLDGLFFLSLPNLFTFGFLAMVLSSEFFKKIIERQSWFGRTIVTAVNAAVFIFIYYLTA